MGLLARLFGTGRAPRDLLADLADTYRAEVQQALLLRAHAEQARYAQIATALRQLADTEERHAEWLRERLIALGGVPPVVEARPPRGASPWQRAVDAHERAQAKRRRVVEQIAHWDPDEPDAVALLRRIEDEDHGALALYDGIVMRSDPHALD